MNDFTRLTQEQGFRVHGWMRTLFDLTGTELLIFAIVYSYTKSGGDGVGGNRFFMEWTGAGRNTVIRALDSLEAAGLISATETGQGKIKKYTVSEHAKKRIGEPVKNLNQSQNETSPKMGLVPNNDYHQSQNGTTTSPKIGLDPSQNGTSNQTIKENESKLERKPDNTTPDINSTPREELPPIAERAMRPPEAPAFHEVYSTMESLTFRPSGTELERCVRAFYDREERQGWKGNWKGKVQSYAASWLNNHPPTHYRQPQRQQARGCQPDDTPVDYGEIPW